MVALTFLASLAEEKELSENSFKKKQLKVNLNFGLCDCGMLHIKHF